jgi:hypothetical protein
MLLWRNSVAAAVAFYRSARYVRRLGIQPFEIRRYLGKAISLSLCYSEIIPDGGFRASVGAGTAAFLCCAYDVVTDWRAFDCSSFRCFDDVLHEVVSEQATRALALDLYDRERNRALDEDGLERGPIALRFILALANANPTQESNEFEVIRLGRLLQIVDDVLDYEDDIAHGDLNCLTSPNRARYLRELISDFEPTEVRRAFGGRSSILAGVIEKARLKAARLAPTG